MPIQSYTENKNLIKISQGSTDSWDVWANSNLDLLDAPLIELKLSAAENLSSGDLVVIKDDGAGAKKAYLATSVTYTFGDPLCIATKAVSAGAASSFVIKGRAQHTGWAFTSADKHLYLSTSGAVTTIETNVRLGFALSSTSIWFSPDLASAIAPTFSAHLGGVDQTAIVSGAGWTKVGFFTTEVNKLNNFDTVTARFTPKTPGVYRIVASVTWKTFAAVSTATTSIHKNGIEYKTAYCPSPGSGGITGMVSILVEMNGSTDYLEVFVKQDTGSNKDIDGATVATWVSGEMVK